MFIKSIKIGARFLGVFPRCKGLDDSDTQRFCEIADCVFCESAVTGNFAEGLAVLEHVGGDILFSFIDTLLPRSVKMSPDNFLYYITHGFVLL